MIGRVIRIFSDFYYIETETGIVEAKLRNILKKQKEAVVTGDFVVLEQFNSDSMQAFINSVTNRKNLINRPKVANVTQAVIVSALKEPNLNFEQLNRYIAHCEFHNLKIVLCFNKEDIEPSKDLKQKINDIYSQLGYKIIYTSALKRTGLVELKPLLKNNTSILCGSSGVGKSSLINALLNSNKIRTLSVSEKNKKGVHTTRHCELIEIEKNLFIVDTPGFSRLKFDFLSASEIANLFKEFKDKQFICKYKNCLHIGEQDCGAKEIITNMNNIRYESYKKFVIEAKEYEEKISKMSIKNELNVKYNQNKLITKISHKKRNTSRKTKKQNIYKEEL